jgi:DNA polymerase (family X)
MRIPLSADLTNTELAEVFEFIAAVLEVTGADRFRTRAYQNAADTFHHLDQEVKDMVKEHQDLSKLPGIGKTIAEKLTELYKTGDIAAFQKYAEGIPEGMWGLLPVVGIGPRFAHQLSLQFGLDDAKTAVEQLLARAKNGELRGLDGFGEKREAEIISALEAYSGTHHRISYAEAHKIAKQVMSYLTNHCPGITKIEALGSLRRQSTSVGDIDLGIVVDTMGPVKKAVKNLPALKRVVAEGDQLIRLTLDDNVQVDIKTVPAAEWGSFLQHFTGSKDHNIYLREYALQKGKSLSEHGIKDVATGEMKTYDTEEEFYAALGLNWIPPQERTGSDEIKKYKK